MKEQNTMQHDIITTAYRLKGFLIRRFSLIEPGKDIRSEFNPELLKLGINIEFSSNVENNIFLIILTIINKYELAGKEITLLDLDFLSEFEISDMKSVIKIENENFNIPDELLINFISLTYSSARGIIFAKTQGSYLNQYILPVIDPKVLLEHKLRQMKY